MSPYFKMNSFSSPHTCIEENNFVNVIQTQDRQDPLFYAFTNYQGRIAAEFSLTLDNAINLGDDRNISKMLILHMNDELQSWGLISASLLHKTCGPYPEIESKNKDSFDFIVQTFLLPILTIMVLVTNACVCMVFSRRHMLNPVFLILFVIGLMELANSLLPLPFYLAQSWFQRRNWWESLSRYNLTSGEHLLENTHWTPGPFNIYQTSSSAMASQTSAWTTVFLPTITHTCSVWLTITLALQRLIYVSRPNDTSKMCTLNRSILISLIILFGSCMIHLPLLCSRFVEFKPIQLRTKLTESSSPNLIFNQVCLSDVVLNLPAIAMKCHNLEPEYMFTYFYARLVLIHLMPCGILAILTSLLVWRMRQITKLRRRLNTHSPQKFERQCSLDSAEHLSKSNSSRSFKCLEICHKRFGFDSNAYVHDSTQENHMIPSSKQVNKIQSEIININKRKQNPMGSPQAISRMLIVVLIKFIAMHLPNAIALLVYVLITVDKRELPLDYESDQENYLNQSLTLSTPLEPLVSTPSHLSTNPVRLTQINQPDYWARLSTMCNLIILVSYQLNFFIYYTMSTAFRQTFKQLCVLHLNCKSCLNNFTKPSTSLPISLPEDTNQSNQTMNQTESGDNDKNLKQHSQTRQIIPILVETQID